MADVSERQASAHRVSSRWSAALGLILVLASEYLMRAAFISQGAGRLQLGIAIGVEWAVALFLLLYWIPKVERRSLGSIGFRKFRLRFLWITIGAYVVYALVSMGLETLLKAAGLTTLRDLSPTLKDYGFPLLLGLFLTGTFVEEILYRGYLIERLTQITGRRWVGALVSWAAFGLVHLKFFGVGPTLEVSVIGAIFVALYLASKSIWPSIVAHGINDTIGFLIGPYLG